MPTYLLSRALTPNTDLEHQSWFRTYHFHAMAEQFDLSALHLQDSTILFDALCFTPLGQTRCHLKLCHTHKETGLSQYR